MNCAIDGAGSFDLLCYIYEFDPIMVRPWLFDYRLRNCEAPPPSILTRLVKADILLFIEA